MNKLWYLSKINFFKHMTEEDMINIDRCSYMKTFIKKERIFWPDDPDNTIYLLKEGQVKISKLNEDGREITLTVLQEGEIFGETALTSAPESRRGVYAEALADCLVCVIKNADFEAFLRTKPDFAINMLQLLSNRLQEREEVISEMVFHNVPARLANLLVKLAEEHGIQTEEGIKISTKLSHQLLASLIGSTRETTTKYLNEFDEADMIRVKRGGIVVVALNKLKNMVRKGSIK